MSDPIDVKKWMPSIKRIAHQQLPLAELREKLCEEREATKELTDEIKHLAKRAREADHGASGLWLANHASRLEKAVSEYANRNESL
tara:strand:+ start:1477 stop:1734 length:258 start_codon:yes stop_codon:yes gene_type:complete